MLLENLPKGKFTRKIAIIFAKPLAQTRKSYYNYNVVRGIIKTVTGGTG
jgi:hypothetical protein